MVTNLHGPSNQDAVEIRSDGSSSQINGFGSQVNRLLNGTELPRPPVLTRMTTENRRQEERYNTLAASYPPTTGEAVELLYMNNPNRTHATISQAYVRGMTNINYGKLIRHVFAWQKDREGVHKLTGHLRSISKLFDNYRRQQTEVFMNSCDEYFGTKVEFLRFHPPSHLGTVKSKVNNYETKIWKDQEQALKTYRNYTTPSQSEMSPLEKMQYKAWEIASIIAYQTSKSPTNQTLKIRHKRCKRVQRSLEYITNFYCNNRPTIHTIVENSVRLDVAMFLNEYVKSADVFLGDISTFHINDVNPDVIAQTFETHIQTGIRELGERVNSNISKNFIIFFGPSPSDNFMKIYNREQRRLHPLNTLIRELAKYQNTLLMSSKCNYRMKINVNAQGLLMNASNRPGPVLILPNNV